MTRQNGVCMKDDSTILAVTLSSLALTGVLAGDARGQVDPDAPLSSMVAINRATDGDIISLYKKSKGGFC